jgi:hypothetical protein
LRREIRAGVRLGVGTVALALAYGLIADYGTTLLALELALIVALAASSALGCRAALGVQSGRAWVRPAHLALGAVGGVAYRGALEWNHTRRHIRPLHLALGELLGVPRAVRPRSWLDVPRSFATREGAKITVRLPKGFALTADVGRQVVADLVCAKLGLEAAAHKWHLAGDRPRVVFTVQVPPPEAVRLADVRELLGKIADTALLVGLGRGRAPVEWSLTDDSPHACLSCGSGGGKSATARALIAQHLARGGVALILDVKRLSHAYARGLAAVRYCRDIAEIHDALIWLAGEIDRRNEAADQGADIDGNTDAVDIGPRILVVVEELNATAARLNKHWQKIKGKDDPKQSPATEALGDCLFMGRQVKVNALVIAQFLSARILGGGEPRENIGCRALGRFTVNNWRALAPECWPPPRSSRHPGRLQVVVAGQAKECQALFTTAAEARELATSGIVTPFPDTSEMTSSAAVIPLHAAAMPGPVGLREAVTSGVLPVPEGSTPARWLVAVRSARARDPEFPAAADEDGPRGERRYDPGELMAWAKNRPRAGAA